MKTIRFIILLAFILAKVGSFAQILQHQEADSIKYDASKLVGDTLSMSSDTNLISSFSEPVLYESEDSLYFSLSTREAFMYQNAKISSGTMNLDANFVRIDMATNTLFAYGVPDSLGNVEGKPVFKDGSQEFASDTIRYNMKSKRGIVKNVRSEQEGGYLHGGITKVQADKHIHIRDGKYTTCDAEHPHFYISMTKAEVIPKKEIISGPLYFVILDIPTPFGLPFGFFPTNSKRKSGILMPQYGEDNNRGFFLRDGGFYWAASDYVDMALVGGIYSRGSWEAKLTSQFRKKYKYSGNFDFTLGRSVIGEEGLPGYTDKLTYKLGLSYNQDAKANPNSKLSARISYDGGQFREYNSTNLSDYINTTNSSSVSYSLTPSKDWNFTASASGNQNTRTHLVNFTAPKMDFNLNSRYLFGNDKTTGDRKWYEKFSYSYSASGEARITGADSSLFSRKTEVQAGYRHSIPLSASFNFWKYFSFSPSVNYTGMVYPSYIKKNWYPKFSHDGIVTRDTLITDTINQTRYVHSLSPSASLSFSPNIFGFFEFRENSKIAAIRHMIKPNISIGITPDSKKMVSKYFDTYTRYVNGKEVSTTYSKYESGIYGSPTGSSESGSVSFSLSNQVEMKIRNDLQADTSKTDKEKFRKIALIENLSFNTSYNFFAEGTKWADVSMSGSTGLFKKKISINLSATFTPYDNDQEGTKINEFRFVNGKSMFRMTQANIGLSGSIDPTTFDPKNTAPIIPWRMSINYGLSINSNWITASQTYNIKTSQSLTINGSLEFTKKWNLQYGTGYDFENKKVTSTNLNITRDLHCWQMSMNWIPFGQLKSYSFQINVKASVFDGIKYNLREDIIRSSF